jgi:hypothetical protein
MRRAPAPRDFDGWVAQLGVPSCRQRAKGHLLQSGPAALGALRRGLRHPDPLVRRSCVNLLDRFLDTDAVADVIAAVDDEDSLVCARALHALACDACKQGECRPGEELWMPAALRLLGDASTERRAGAIDALGKIADRRPQVAAALARVAETDPDAGLRGMARNRIRKLGMVAPS